MKIYLLAGIMAALCLQGQAQDSTIKPLTVGDTVPDITFTNIINRNKKKLNLYSFKEKHIIIDLWNRHCRACLTAFPKVEQFQKKYPDQLQIILANPHDAGYEKEIMALLNGIKERTGFYPTLPIALNDTLLNHLFPHNGVPHYIWINDKRQIAAITGLEELTEQNIKRFVSGEYLHLATKDAPEFKKDLLALIRSGEIKDTGLISYSFFTGYQPYTNLKTNYVRGSKNSIVSYHIINKPLSFYINKAFYSELNGIPSNRVFNYPTNKDSVYCYQLKPGNPIINPDGLRNYIRTDLQRAFHFTGELKKRKMECLVIKDIRYIERLKSKYAKADIRFSTDNSTSKYIRNIPLQSALSFVDKLPLPLVNETPYTNHVIDFEFPKGFNPENEQELIGWLQSNGFVITKEDRTLDVFEFSSTL